MASGGAPPYLRRMSDPSTVEHEPETIPPPVQPPVRHRVWRSRERILLGVAGGLANALGVAPLWTRLGFVVLALFDGLGLRSTSPPGCCCPPDRPRRRRACPGRVVGLLVVPVWLAAIVPGRRILGSDRRACSASWWCWSAWPWRCGTPRWPATATAAARAASGVRLVGGDAAGARSSRAVRGRLPRRWAASPSVPRCWWRPSARRSVRAPAQASRSLRAGRGRCGVGLLVGTVYGRARWLVVPAVLFAGVSVAGAATEDLGVHLSGSTRDTFWGPAEDGPPRLRPRSTRAEATPTCSWRTSRRPSTASSASATETSRSTPLRTCTWRSWPASDSAPSTCRTARRRGTGARRPTPVGRAMRRSSATTWRSASAVST